MKKDMKNLLLVGAVIVGGYFLYKTIIAPMGIFATEQDVGRTRVLYPPIQLYPSMTPVGGPYPSPSPFHDVSVF